jgi:CheY-like chemotaxis protein/class 3 adenylate cyclase
MTARSGAVLVVDDDKMNRIMLSRLLENEGYRPTAVVDGEEALDAVAKERFDAVLLDVMMPGVDGIEVLRTLKSDSRWWHIPVIMISALEETESIVRCIELGAEDYLLKPFDPVLLRARVNACLARKRFHDLEEEYHAIVREQREELGELNRQFSERLWSQVGELERVGRLRRFFPAGLVEQLAAAGGADRLAPHRADVVVVAVALSGAAAVADGADPAETIRLLNEFHAVLAELVQEAEATVVSAAGDILTVVFNDPEPSPDGPTRAQRFTTRAGEELAALLAQGGSDVELALGVGIAEGVATLGEVGPKGRCDYIAIGAVVDEAQRRARAGP